MTHLTPRTLFSTLELAQTSFTTILGITGRIDPALSICSSQFMRSVESKYYTSANYDNDTLENIEEGLCWATSQRSTFPGHLKLVVIT
jgi:hypothetical protein